MKLRHTLLLCIPLVITAFAAPEAVKTAPAPVAPAPTVLADILNQNADRDWFLRDRFGLFIHFGLYANAARHEWVMNREKISPTDYRRYFDTFNPDLFDARAWAKAARKAGMKYAVLTVKHHEGFCLFDSKLTDYKITNTPFGRDLVREYVEALRAEGLRVGFYYSLIDWHHPEFPVDGFHPMREDEAFKKEAAGRDIKKYTAYLHGQVRELLSNYGQIDYLWFDFSYPSKDWGWSKGKGPADWQSEELVKMIHELQPKIILNNRLGLKGGGVETPEQYQPRVTEAPKELKLVEECHTMNGSWGYDRDNLAWKPSEMLVRMLIDGASKGNNLLLNVGPTGRGEFDPRAKERLAALGEWTRLHGRAIYGTTPSAFVPPDGMRYTQNGKRLYLHLYTYPLGRIELDGLAGKVSYAQFLNDGSELKFSEPKPKESENNMSAGVESGAIELKLPTLKPEVLVPVVELFLK